MRMKIVAVVVLYHPDLQIVQENLMAFTYQVDKTLIWDNSPGETSVKNEICSHMLSFRVMALITGFRMA